MSPDAHGPAAGHEHGTIFKPVHILIFSLVPLALVFIGVIGGSIHGSDSARETFPSAPAASPTPRSQLPQHDQQGPRLTGLPWESSALS